MENNEFGQKKSKWKSDTKCHNKCGIICFYNYKPQAKWLLMKNKVIADEEKKDIQQHIAATANSITKSLQRKNLFKRRIKEINYL